MLIPKTLYTLGFLVAVVATAYANDRDGEGKQEGLLEELTVTADRRPTAFAMTMASQDFYGAQELQFIDADHISELLKRGAGVNFHRGSGAEYLGAIRSPVLNGGAGAGSFLLLEDSIPTRAAGFANVNGLAETFFEAASGVEVVKGPGSALFGSNAVHGTVNVLSPVPGESDRRLRLSLGSFGFGQLQASGETSAGGSVYRADTFFARDDGFRESSEFDVQKIKLQHLREKPGRSVRTVLDLFNLNQNTAGFLQGENAYKDKALAQTTRSQFLNAYRDWRSIRVHQKRTYERNDGSALVLTPYLRSNDMEFLQHFILPVQPLEKNGHDSFGVQSGYYFDVGRHELVLGSDVEYTQGYVSVFQSAATGSFGGPVYPQGIHYDFDVEARTASLFFQNRLNLSEQLKLEIGARAEYVRYDYNNNADVFRDAGTRVQRIADRRDEFLQVTPKLSAAYEIDDWSSLAVKLSRGERAPNTNDLYRVQVNQLGGQAKVESLDSAELSYRLNKASFFAIEAALFYMKKDNFFFRDGDGFNVIDGKTRHEGVEFSVDTQLATNLSLQVDATYARHRYDFANAASSITKGDDIDSAPRRLANVRLRYATKRVRQSLELSYVGRYYTDAANAHSYPGHSVLVWHSAYQIDSKRQLFWRVNNLTDRRYAERADFAFGNERYFPGKPRSAVVGFELLLD